MGDNSNNLKRMLKIYKPNGFDWMNFVLSRRNPYTFHHIISKSNGGEDSIANGAILTRRAHNLLHIIEYICPEAYEDLEDIFYRINVSKRPPDDEIKGEVDAILHAIFMQDGYQFIEDVDLNVYENLYYENRKGKVRKLKK